MQDETQRDSASSLLGKIQRVLMVLRKSRISRKNVQDARVMQAYYRAEQRTESGKGNKEDAGKLGMRASQYEVSAAQEQKWLDYVAEVGVWEAAQ